MAASRILTPLADLRYPAPQNLTQTQDRLRVDKHINDNIARINETFARITEVELQHGVPTLIPNPFAGGPVVRQPLAFLNGYAATEDGTRYDIASFRIGEPRTDGFIEVTASFDLRHTEPYADYRKSASQSTPNATNTPLTWDVLMSSRGSGIVSIASSSRVTLAEAGTYLFSCSYVSATGGGRRQLYFIKNGVNASSGDRWGDQQWVDASTVPRGSSSAPIKLAAGDYVEAIVRQDSGGALDAIGNAAPECSLQVARLYNDSTPTCLVSGILVAG